MLTDAVKGVLLGLALVASITITICQTRWAGKLSFPTVECSAPPVIQKKQAPVTYPPLRSRTEFATATLESESERRSVAGDGWTGRLFGRATSDGLD